MEQYDLPLELGISDILMAAGPALTSKRYDGIGEYFIEKTTCYDSGAFKFLFDKELAKLITPDRVLETYERLQYNKDTLLIQLDKPTDFYDSLEHRKNWITESASNYHYMKAKNKQIIPVLHGWNAKELEFSMDRLLDADLIAVGSNTATATRGIPNFALGSNASTSQAKINVGNQHVGVGSYSSKVVPQIMSVASASAEEKRKRTPSKILYPRFGTAMSLLKKRGIEKIMVLGAGGIGWMHISFASGAEKVDGSSWKMAASMFYAIFVPGSTGTRRFMEMERPTCKMVDNNDINILQELHKQPDYPFTDIPFKLLSEMFATKGKEGFLTRAIHNVYVIKYEIETISMKYANDPDRYFAYLQKRWAKSHYWRPRLKMVMEALTEDYLPQADLRSYFKMNPRDTKMFLHKEVLET